LATLGKWSKAPLAYVVADIVVPKMADDEKLYRLTNAALIHTFPIFAKNEVQSITMDPGMGTSSISTELMLDYRNVENTVGIRVTNAGVQLHVVEYVNFPAFVVALSDALNILRDVFQPRHLMRLGLRYVDLIVPESGLNTYDYLAPSVCPVHTVPGVGQAQDFNVGLLVRQGELVSRQRIIAHMTLGLSLPPNFLPMPIKLSAMQQAAVEAQRAGRGIAIVDTDVSFESPQPYNHEALLPHFDRMHDLLTATFLASVTPNAIARWKDQT
jgi:uncharacterized protein (TIGR04255 family)